MTEYKFLFKFATKDNDKYIVEVKRLGLPKDATPDKVYAWLLVEKDDSKEKDAKFEQLGFVSMEEGKRVFKQGKFEFNDKKATYISNENKEIELICLEKVDDAIIIKAVDKFIG